MQPVESWEKEWTVQLVTKELPEQVVSQEAPGKTVVKVKVL